MATRQEEALQGGGPSIIARARKRLLVAASLIAVLCLYWPTTVSLSELWLDTSKTTYTHGFIVLSIAFWLILRDERFERTEIHGADFRILALYVLSSFGWLVAYRAGIETAHELAFPVLAWFAIWSVFGLRVARLSVFPIGFLIFAVPVWDVLTTYLQTLSATMVGYMLHLSGIDAYVDGSLVHIGVGTFEIAGGCSGLHFVMVGLALGALYGELGRDSIKTRGLLVSLALFLALAANWLRVYVIVVAGYLTNMQHYLVRVEHYRFGWFVFAVMMMLFFWIASRFPSAEQPPVTVRSTAPSVKSTVRYACLALGLLAVPSWNSLHSNHLAAMPSGSEIRPETLVDWHGPIQGNKLSWTPAFVGADAESMTTYERSDGQVVALYVAAYRDQRQDKELVGYHNHLLDDSDTVVESRSASHHARDLIVERGRQSDVVRFSYEVGGLDTSSGLVAQLAYGVKSLWSAPLSRIVAVRTHCASDCEAARKTLDSFESSLQSRAAH